MEITEVRIKLMPSKNDKLRAFCSITLEDSFVIRDLKIIEGLKGPFVAMPSRKLMQHCPRCRGKNHHRASFCNVCGVRLPVFKVPQDASTRVKLHADIAHPINSRCREFIQKRILEHYAGELEKAKDPGYRPAEMEVFDEEFLRDELSEAVIDEDTTTGPAEGPRGSGARVEHPPARPGQESRGARRRGERQPWRGARQPGPGGDPAGRPAAGRRAPARLQSADPERPVPSAPLAVTPDPEPEDNFGVGLFS